MAIGSNLGYNRRWGADCAVSNRRKIQRFLDMGCLYPHPPYLYSAFSVRSLRMDAQLLQY